MALTMTHFAFGQNNKVVSAWNYLTYYERDGDKESLKVAQEAINEAAKHENTKGNAKTWFYKGRIEHAMTGEEMYKDNVSENRSSAFESFKNCLELDKKGRHKDDVIQSLRVLTSDFYTQGVDNYNAKDFEASYNDFNKVVEIRGLINENIKKPEAFDTASHQAAALSAERAGMDSEAIVIYEKMYDMDIVDAASMQSLIGLYKKTGNADKASKMSAKARELFPDNQGLLIDEINEMLAGGNSTGAIEKIQKAIDNDPENKSLHFALGSAKDAMKDMAGAKAAYQKALDIDPGYFDALYNIGAIFFNQGADLTKKMADLGLDEQAEYDRMDAESKNLFKEALPFFEKALESSPKDQNTMIALKEIYAKTGDFENSKKMKELLGM